MIVAQEATPDYVHQLAQEVVTGANSAELTTLERAFDRYLFLQDVYRASQKTTPPRHRLIFTDPVTTSLKAVADALRDNREAERDRALQERRAAVEEEHRQREAQREMQRKIRDYGIPEWDFD